MFLKFHHIGIACYNIKEEIEIISKIHTVIEVSPVVMDTEQKAELCILKTLDGIVIELIAGEQVKNILRKKITYYHLCFETDDIDSEIDRLLNLGGFLISEPKPAILFENRKVAFIQVSYGIIELVQSY